MSTATPEQRVRALGLAIPTDITPAANYDLLTRQGELLYLSGQLPRIGNQVAVSGRVGSDISLEQARHAAGLCTLRALGVLRLALGSLDLVGRVLKLQAFVQCAPDFSRHSDVADAASDLLVQVFGDRGRPARTVLGVYQLPRHASVELDLIVAVSAPHTLEEAGHAAVR